MIAINQCSSVIATSHLRSDRGYPRVTIEMEAVKKGTIGSRTLWPPIVRSARVYYDAASPVAFCTFEYIV